jgi:hypothetical protein
MTPKHHLRGKSDSSEIGVLNSVLNTREGMIN